ncbi:hypothetical protein Moror_6596 [Moniliophthora roreri MCA 2997]|uniref:Uncharacterized protein n=2 Tax=Moniliophthora roreri TaxID=221103 RepID=V2XCU2_MONRO|nr:hypothetical protein Moror_6596 [Moniliophthora roreri MCA 2997]
MLSSSTANAAFSLVFYLAIPAFLFFYLIQPWSRKFKIYVFVAYFVCVLGRFAAPIFVFNILRWVVMQIIRGCKALAWFGFYLTFFMTGMQFVLKGFWGAVEFLEGLAKAMDEQKEEERMKEEAEKRGARARAADPGATSEGEAAGDTPKKHKENPKKSKRKR